MRLHPPEVSLVHSKKEARAFFEENGFDLDSYAFGPGDLFVQAIVVGTRRGDAVDQPARARPRGAHPQESPPARVQ
jgi:hypothetical protein